MLFVLARILTLAIRNYPGTVSSVPTPIPFAKASSPVPKATATHKKGDSGALTMKFRGWNLHSTLREYTYVFTGKVACRTEPCAAEIQVVLNTDQNPDVRKTATTLPDGSYSVEISIKDYMHEGIDWKLTAQYQGSEVVDAHGRQILMDDPTVTVENSLQLS